MNKALIVAGNGPSLTTIDYTLFPEEFDVYRCNQFYFEDKYYLGKKITGVFFIKQVFFLQYYTLYNLQERNEYTYDNLYYVGHWTESQPLSYIYPTATPIHDILYQSPQSSKLIRYHEYYINRLPTTGILMALIGAIQGYKDIYITGIDFYENNNYGFQHKKENILQIIPEYNSHLKTSNHTQEYDISILHHIQKEFGANLYALSPHSPLSKILPLSPIYNPTPYSPIEKPLDAIQDIMIPPHKQYLTYHIFRHDFIESNIFISSPNASHQQTWLQRERRSNFYIKLIEDAVRVIKFCLSSIKYLYKKRKDR